MIRLAKLLAQLFLDVASSERIMAQAGIERGRILAEQTASTRWFFIVQEAEKAGKVAALIDAALTVYPKHEALLRLKAQIFTGGITCHLY